MSGTGGSGAEGGPVEEGGAPAAPPDGEREGRVLRILAGSYEVETEEGLLECVLAGRLKQGGDVRVAVGDRVRLERTEDGSGRIVEALPRGSKLARRSVARRAEQVIVANIDQVGAIFSVARPDPDLRMLDRLLVLAELNGLDAFVVANKIDLGAEGASGGDDRGQPEAGDRPEGREGRRDVVDDPEAEDGPDPPPLPSAFHPYRSIGYPVLPTSVPEERGLEPLRERLRGRTTALTGPSGAGKSSLLNALDPALDRRVGEVSEGPGTGRHTTVNATLIPLPEGGYVADTPGLQLLELWDLGPAELSGAFPEFRPLLGDCRFNDCRHDHEPGCAIREALGREELHETRYRSYRKLLAEAEERSREW